ncbi:MAG: chorismate mutase [Gemmatimonadetes bacterium]|nr:chorismate mutase [Gemmatimonadota bacterium]
MKQAEQRLRELRDQIAELDAGLVRLIGERRRLAIEIGVVKSTLGLPVLDPQREAEVVRHAAAMARELGVDEELTRDVLWRIIASARSAQSVNSGNQAPKPQAVADPPRGNPGNETKSGL